LPKKSKIKQLKSSIAELRRTFDEVFSVRHVTENLASFDAERDVDSVRGFMEEKEFDVVGVRISGYVSGYVERVDLSNGVLRNHLLTFSEPECINESEPLLRLLEGLKRSRRLFVSRQGRVYGIVTKGDLEKGPVRMWLFCVISLLEMQLLRLIREFYPDDGWRDCLETDRFGKVEGNFIDLRRRNEHVDLADCLQFCDKREIVLGTPELRDVLQFVSKTAGGKLLKRLEDLRNDLAHAQSVITGRWPDLVELAGQAEHLAETCERTHVDRIGSP
jgi:predicted transcriptional regulator